MCRMVGGWPELRTVEKWECGRVKEQQAVEGGGWGGGLTFVLLIELLVEIPELTNVKHRTALRPKLLSGRQCKAKLVQTGGKKGRGTTPPNLKNKHHLVTNRSSQQLRKC